MDHILRMMFVAGIAILGLLLNQDLSAKAQTLHFLKEDLEIAVHDAALALDTDELKKGNFLFNRIEAMDTFRNSFEKNSRLTSADYELIGFDFFDDTSGPFPISFTSDVSSFEDVFNSPTVVAVVKTKKNAYFSNTSDETFTQVASYTYKRNIPQSGIPTDDIIGSPNAHGFVWATPYTRNITSVFGMREHPITGLDKLHAGIDIASPGISGAPVVSAKEGTVVFAGTVGGYGQLIVIDHGGGVETRYAHLSATQIATGQTVAAGQVIGQVGNTGDSTGPHLHFEVRVDGRPYDPIIFYP